LGPNILLSTLFSNTLSRCSSYSLIKCHNFAYICIFYVRILYICKFGQDALGGGGTHTQNRSFGNQKPGYCSQKLLIRKISLHSVPPCKAVLFTCFCALAFSIF
jgi:hypothetical protein